MPSNNTSERSFETRLEGTEKGRVYVVVISKNSIRLKTKKTARAAVLPCPVRMDRVGRTRNNVTSAAGVRQTVC